MTGRTRRGSIVAGVVAVAALLGVPVSSPLGLPGIAPVARAAESHLTIVSETRYDVLPEEAVVRATAELTIRYTRAETRARRFYVDHAFLAVMPEASGFRVAGAEGARVRVSRETSAYTLLRIDFGERLYGGGIRRLQLRFDLSDPGGAPSRALRVGEALVAFPVWALASDGAGPSSATVVLPPDYEVDVGSGPLDERTTTEDGRQVLRSGPIANPGTWFAYVVGEGPGAYAERSVTVDVGAESVTLRLRGWRDDPAWTERVGGLLEQALPELAARVGLPWSAPDPLLVEESASRATTASAGRFDPVEGRLEIAYDADPFVILHEAAHAWFNGALLADRWASEGFASLYAVEAASALDVEVVPDALTDDLAAVAVPLNAWDPAADPTTEAFGYAAALELARAVRARAGDAALRAVWEAAASRVGAYQPPAVADAPGVANAAASGDDASLDRELTSGPPDWRGLLDLLEDASGRRFDDLWRTWVVRPQEAALLDARTAARASYDRTLRLGDGWALPRGVRDALRAWRFEVAETYLADLRTVIAQREALESAAVAAELALPGTVREAFESGRLADASAAAVAETDAIAVIEDAAAARPIEPDAVTQLGLLDQEPDVALAAARAAFSSGDVAGAVASAVAARTTWDQAWDLGRRRILIGLAVLVGLVLLAAVAISTLRGRRGRFATLAADPTPPATDEPGVGRWTATTTRPRGDAPAGSPAEQGVERS